MMRATSWEAPYIHIECGCSKEWSIEDLYYCYHCAKIICPYCLNEEIDSFYCRNCIENMPTTEANAFKNRCSRCFQCPVCVSTLQIQHHSHKNQKYYHFSCQSCYWDSVNFDMKGGTLNELFQCNQELSNKDTVLSDRFKYLLEPYKEIYRNRRKPLVRYPSMKEAWTMNKLEESQKPKESLELAEKARPKDISLDDILSENLIYSDITSMPQRLMNLGLQSREITKSALQPMQLLTKRCKRCKTCKKYVLKPEINQNTTSFFKMENLLVNIFPKFLIREIRGSEIILLIFNPNQSISYAGLKGFKVPDKEIHVNSYDSVMDMVTQEGNVNDGFERDKNCVVVNIGRQSNKIIFQMLWKFMRGIEHKTITSNIHIKLKD